jgi:GNAT superfamily N-acetyltransferase
VNGVMAIGGPSDCAARGGARASQLYLWGRKPRLLPQGLGWPGRAPEGKCRLRPDRGQRADPRVGLLHAVRHGDLAGRCAGGGAQARPALPSGERDADRSPGCREEHQGQRLGAVLLVDALQRAFDTAGTVGSSMVVVDALDEAAAGFYAAHGFVRLPDSLRLVLPMRMAAGSTERS